MNDSGSVFVVKDGISSFGLRQVHLLSPGGKIGTDGLSETAEREGGTLLAWEWVDELLGNWHVYGIWRLGMSVSYPMFCVTVEKGKEERAIWGAVMGWIRRRTEDSPRVLGGGPTTEMPNRVVARCGVVGWERVALRAEELKLDQDVVLERVEAGEWFPAGVVGVYRVEVGNDH